MESSVAQYQSKIKLLLQKFLVSSCQLEIDCHLDKFLEHLRHQDKKEETTSLILPIFTEWISQAVAIWSSKNLTPPSNIGTFSLNLASLLASKEDRFCVLNNNNFFIKLVNVLKARHLDVSPCVKLAYIKLLSAFLEHKSGIEWMMACNFWEDLYQMALTKDSVGVTEESYKFLAKFLGCVINHDENLCNNVIKKIMLPLGENIYRSLKASADTIKVVDEITSQNLKPTLALIGHILEHFLEGVLYCKKDFRVLFMFLKNFHLEERISDFMLIARNKCLMFDLGKIMFIMQFLELYVNVVSKRSTVANTKNALQAIKKSFILNVSKDPYENALKFCNFGHLFWNIMAVKISPFCANNKSEIMEFANQFILIQLLPNFCCMISHGYTIPELEILMDDVFRNVFIQKVFKMSCQDIIRSAFHWRDHLIQCSNVFELCFESLTYVKKSRRHFPRERAVIVFQALVYNLKDTMLMLKDRPHTSNYIDTAFDYYPLVFELLVILVEEFKITWRDSFETIDVMDVCFDFLSLPNWSVNIVVEALNLVNVSITKYMTPNLALLVDGATDSTVTLLAPLIYAKLYDEVPEVKRAALEIVCTISRLSVGKFPSLQKVLLDSELPALVVKMSSCDSESFVRATAIKCLQEMIQVDEIWKNVLESAELPQNMRRILLNETEGIVRVEAATFMCVAYEHHQFPKESLDKVYETMIHSSTTDLHWEVKVRALGFWDKVIKNHLQHQGMIDGSFPNVTFSKEHRKIVTLNDAEIRKRLQKVLTQLSMIGCLGVLVSAIKDDCDIEVSKTAVIISQVLADLFKKYNVRSDSSAPTSPLPTDNGMSSAISSVSSGISMDDTNDIPQSNQELNEEIINQIVNSKDVSLLKNVYSPSDYGSVINYDFQVRKIVTPDQFIQFTQQDLNNIITEKKNWLNGIEDLGSLLDDMLKTYDDDVNNMDCY